MHMDHSSDKSKYEKIEKNKQGKTMKFNFVFFLDQHVSLSIMHIENEPIFQNYYVQAEGNNNRTLEKCLRKIYVRICFHFSEVVGAVNFVQNKII